MFQNVGEAFDALVLAVNWNIHTTFSIREFSTCSRRWRKVYFWTVCTCLARAREIVERSNKLKNQQASRRERCKDNLLQRYTFSARLMPTLFLNFFLFLHLRSTKRWFQPSESVKICLVAKCLHPFDKRHWHAGKAALKSMNEWKSDGDSKDRTVWSGAVRVRRCLDDWKVFLDVEVTNCFSLMWSWNFFQ